MSKDALEICRNCFYREEQYCCFDPGKNTIEPSCHYSFPAIEVRKLKIGER
jgi:hypothetical protein